MRYTTAGESHGRALVTIVTGVPAGVPLEAADVDADLGRRQVGYGRGGRMTIESDRAMLLSGVRFGRTIGSPVAITVANRDWENWTDVMAPGGGDEAAQAAGKARVTAPRPGHADLAGCLKTGASDVRDVLERASARETAARVAAGAVAKALLRGLGVSVGSYVRAIGGVQMEPLADAAAVDVAAVEASDVRCPDEAAAARMRDRIDEAAASGESLGGVFTVYAIGLAPGLGGYATAGERLDARLAGAVVSIPAIKGVEFGDGFALAAGPGSEAHDPILPARAGAFVRPSNHAGGLEGGMTNGEPLVLSAAMKPIPTLMKSLPSVDLETGEPVDAARERSDVCAVPAAAVVAEAEVALVLADAYQAKVGGDCLGDMLAALAAYTERTAR
ncbi:MAG: chorismate synthase [Actinobacteria bacterium]|nr:MAG: chorismate synthase [Actinomycetota bacterium]